MFRNEKGLFVLLLCCYIALLTALTGYQGPLKQGENSPVLYQSNLQTFIPDNFDFHAEGAFYEISYQLPVNYSCRPSQRLISSVINLTAERRKVRLFRFTDDLWQFILQDARPLKQLLIRVFLI